MDKYDIIVVGMLISLGALCFGGIIFVGYNLDNQLATCRSEAIAKSYTAEQISVICAKGR